MQYCKPTELRILSPFLSSLLAAQSCTLQVNNYRPSRMSPFSLNCLICFAQYYCWRYIVMAVVRQTRVPSNGNCVGEEYQHQSAWTNNSLSVIHNVLRITSVCIELCEHQALCYCLQIACSTSCLQVLLATFIAYH